MISLDGHLVGSKCGARSCVDCHRQKLSKWVSVAEDLKQHQDEVLRASVLTPPERLTSHQAVSDWLKGVRAFLRQWTRSAGLGFAFWVAEAVPKWDELSETPCPLLTAPPDEWLNGSSSSLKDTLLKAHHECKIGGNCRFCRGSGYLPAMHVHVHLLSSSLPFWYGDEPPPTETPKQRDLATRYPPRWIGVDGRYTGFVGACRRHGMGVSRSEEIQSYKGIQGYISKACLAYVSKGTKEIDWSTSAVNAALASWTFGDVRTRGAVGRAYGLNRRTKDTSTRPEYVTDAARLCYQLEAAGDNRLAAVTEERELIEAPKRDNNPDKLELMIDVLEVGIKAQKAPGLSKVLQKTQVDKGASKDDVGFLPPCGDGKIAAARPLPSIPLEYTDGALLALTRQMVHNEVLSRSWNGSIVVNDHTTWAAPIDPKNRDTGWYLGRGSSVISTLDPIHKLYAPVNARRPSALPPPLSDMPKTKRSVLELILKRISKGLPWEAWRLSLGHLQGRASLSQEVFYDAKIRKMARTISRNEPKKNHTENRRDPNQPVNVRTI